MSETNDNNDGDLVEMDFDEVYRWAESQIDQKEIEAARRTPGGISTQELLRRIKLLTQFEL